MSTSKILVSFVAAFCVMAPAYAAQQVRDPSTISEKEAAEATRKAMQSVPVNEEGTYDMSKVKMSKKDYVEQLNKSFDLMDINKDGEITGDEMMAAQKAASSGYDTHAEKTKQVEPVVKAVEAPAPSAPVKDVPPINAKELNK